MTRKFLLSAVFAAGVVACAAPQERAVADVGWDADENGVLGEDEFRTGLADADGFGAWDADDDGLLSEDEFAETNVGGDFGMFDTDDDGFLNDEEFGVGLFDTWDADDNGVLDDSERASAEGFFNA
jgi:hypothetical protein